MPADREPTEAERIIAYRNAPGWAMEAGWEPPPGPEFERYRRKPAHPMADIRELQGQGWTPEQAQRLTPPDQCGNCGAERKCLSWEPTLGWCCSRCDATDADET